MKQMQSNKNSIAWFKIAECVSRGEKERALGVYRLLSHSFNDDAVARQLEGDIYLSFNEYDAAVLLYRQAMDLYQKSNRIFEAAAVCEHLITLSPDDSGLRKEVIKFYISLDNISLVKKHICKAFEDGRMVESQQLLQEFMSILRAYSDELYEYAVTYIAK